MPRRLHLPLQPAPHRPLSLRDMLFTRAGTATGRKQTAGISDATRRRFGSDRRDLRSDVRDVRRDGREEWSIAELEGRIGVTSAWIAGIFASTAAIAVSM